MELLESYTVLQLATVGVVALLAGMSKTGVHGAGMMSVPIAAMAFGAQPSAGILLPILCIADVLGVLYYHRHASWQHLRSLFPSVVAGTAAGALVGSKLEPDAFRLLLGVLVIVIVAIMVAFELSKKEMISPGRGISFVTGIAGGFTSMVGNLAGPVMGVYFLSMRLPKYVFIGTTAWFFLVLNFFKVPFHILSWGTIDGRVLVLAVLSIPFIVLGAVLGIWLVRQLSENVYRWFIIAMTFTAGILLIAR